MVEKPKPDNVIKLSDKRKEKEKKKREEIIKEILARAKELKW